jgi:Big-like domain-containing protein
MRFMIKLGVSLATVAVVGAAAGIAIGVSGAAGATTAAPEGNWGSAQEIPGIATLTSTSGGHNASDVRALGCSTLGNCAAVGDYGSPVTGSTELFVATEVNGTWGNAQQLTGLPAEASATTPTLTNVSCGTPDFCTAVGTYYTSSALQVFEVTETGGTWGTPVVLDSSGLGSVQSFGFSGLSCPAAGECALIGDYTLTGATPVPFTADESGGNWGSLQPLAGLASLQPSSASAVTGGLTSLSCGAPGDCTAGGTYTYSNSQYGGVQQPFIVSESGHSWGEPQPIPGIASVSTSGQGDEAYQNEVTSVSCPDAGDCAVAGTFFPELNANGLFFTLDEAGGTWGQAKALSLPSGDSVDGPVPFVSCRSAGNCVIAAKVANEPSQSSSGSSAVVTAAESSSGAWGAATAIPGIAAGDEGGVENLACVPAGDCTVLGVYYPGGNNPNEIFSATSPDGGAMGAAQQVASSGIETPTTQLACPQSGHCTVTYNGLDAIVGQPNTYSGPTSPQLVTEVAASTVTLTSSAPTVSYGDEEAETLTATVASPDGGTPTGSVTVTSPGGGTVCTITLVGGTGSCTVAPSALPVGADSVTAGYSGDAAYAAASATASVTVSKGNTATGLALAKTAITYGSETAEKLTATVSRAGSVSPVGTVQVKSGTSVVCTITLANGAGSCTLTANRLVPLTYHLVAVYSGDGNYLPSTSAPVSLTVAKAKTTTGLTLAKTGITYGHETVEKLTASVSRVGSVYATGTVQVKSGTSVVCSFTLANGAGSCTLTAKRLVPRTYHLVAVYLGNGNYLTSTSAAKTLTVAA